MMRRAAVAIAVVVLSSLARAGGPLYVAGVSGFDPGLAGTPVTWAGGAVNYYTDQGDLAPLVTHDQADTLVANAFASWTSIPTAQVTATRAGQLDEDVSGANVTRWSSLPADVMPDSAKPVAVIYDFGGQVLDALLGSGAGAASQCSDNAVLVFHDRFTPDAHFGHALLILNGNCVSSSLDRVFQYRLARAVGRLLGLGWSQLNENVATLAPAPTAKDYAGYPLMHPVAALCTYGYGCVYGVTVTTPRLDDRAALARMYPVVTAGSGKQLFANTTAHVHGAVRFAAWQGLPGQGMQGVSVVARRLDTQGNPSNDIIASSVSGFLYRGHAGNLISGTTTALGEAGDRWGSTAAALEGYYDLAGLEIAGQSTQYELRLEPLNPAYLGERSPGPYRAGNPSPSGSAPAVVVTVTPGGTVVQDFVLQGAAAEPLDSREPHSCSQPAALAAGGEWSATLSGYGDVDWHRLALRAGRSFTFDVTALDDSGAASQQKALPVIGLWDEAAAEGAPALTQATYFNTEHTGITRLQAEVPADGNYKLAIADVRGDGRPDYRYLARLLYVDDVQPRRASTAGGTVLSVSGTGFTPQVTVQIGVSAAVVISYSAEELLVEAPAAADGNYDLVLTDSVSGATASFPGALTYGAGANDDIAVVGRAAGPAVPVGAETEAPLRARVTDPDGLPVAGAAVTFTSSSASFAVMPCNSASCVRYTDGTGEAYVTVLVQAADSATITATLANGKFDSATVLGTQAIDAPTLWSMPSRLDLPQGMSGSVALRVKMVFGGVAQVGKTVAFDVVTKNATAVPATAITNAQGEVTTTINISNLSSQISVIPYLIPNGPVHSADLNIYAVTPTGMHLEYVNGDAQVVSGAFQPLVVRVADGSAPPDGIAGVTVKFHAVAFRPAGDEPAEASGDLVVRHFAQEIAVAEADFTANSDALGHASFTPSFASSLGPLRVVVSATAGAGALDFHLLRIDPASVQQHAAPAGGPAPKPQGRQRLPADSRRLPIE